MLIWVTHVDDDEMTCWDVAAPGRASPSVLAQCLFFGHADLKAPSSYQAHCSCQTRQRYLHVLHERNVLHDEGARAHCCSQHARSELYFSQHLEEIRGVDAGQSPGHVRGARSSPTHAASRRHGGDDVHSVLKDLQEMAQHVVKYESFCPQLRLSLIHI